MTEMLLLNMRLLTIWMEKWPPPQWKNCFHWLKCKFLPTLIFLPRWILQLFCYQGQWFWSYCVCIKRAFFKEIEAGDFGTVVNFKSCEIFEYFQALWQRKFHFLAAITSEKDKKYNKIIKIKASQICEGVWRHSRSMILEVILNSRFDRAVRVRMQWQEKKYKFCRSTSEGGKLRTRNSQNERFRFYIKRGIFFGSLHSHLQCSRRRNSTAKRKQKGTTNCEDSGCEKWRINMR